METNKISAWSWIGLTLTLVYIASQVGLYLYAMFGSGWAFLLILYVGWPGFKILISNFDIPVTVARFLIWGFTLVNAIIIYAIVTLIHGALKRNYGHQNQKVPGPEQGQI